MGEGPRSLCEQDKGELNIHVEMKGKEDVEFYQGNKLNKNEDHFHCHMEHYSEIELFLQPWWRDGLICFATWNIQGSRTLR